MGTGPSAGELTPIIEQERTASLFEALESRTNRPRHHEEAAGSLAPLQTKKALAELRL